MARREFPTRVKGDCRKFKMLTAERLRELLHYDPETGIFTRLVTASSNAMTGDIAGSITSDGYCAIVINRRRYKAHRLAWLYMTGAWPAADIDHIDMDKVNNRFANLREATRTENHGNKRAYANNASGFKGVSWYKREKKWAAQIQVSGKHRHLGLFTTPEAAHAAYTAAAEEYFGDFARTT